MQIMINNKTIILGLLMGGLMTSGEARADIMEPEDALQRAITASGPAKGLKAKALVNVRTSDHVFTVKDKHDTPMAYIFTNTGQGGYMVVSASSFSNQPILGYSDKGDFNSDEMPPNMREWLDGYAAEIASLEKSGSGGSYVKQRSEADKAVIAPLVTTRWNQSAPYNDRCPILNNRRSVTGCMATAEAQVLNYHKFPAKATGTISYKWTSGGGNLACDFDTIPLDWDNMLDNYSANSQSTDRQKLAVANLMLACGMSDQMNYSSSMSGATSLAAAQGAYNHMGCTHAGIILGDWLSHEDLQNYVYNYLTTYGPLLYCGQSSGGGHAFVCDGYNGDGYFHFNWGWGGMSDGYFLLNALNPGSQGIGGTSAGYNTNQQLLVGLYDPAKDTNWSPVMAGDAGMVISSEYNTVLGDTVMIQTTEETGGYWNFNIATVNVTYGAKFVRNATGETTYQECYGIINRDLESMRGWRTYPIEIPKNLAQGTYSVYAAYKVNGSDWKDFMIAQSVQSYTLATVRGDSILFEKPRPADIEINDIAFGTPLYAGGGYTLTAKVRGTGDRRFYGNVSPVLGEYYGEDFVSDFQGAPITIGANPAEDATFTYTGNFSNQRLKGNYKLVFVVTETGKIVSEPIDVELKTYPGVAVPISTDAHIDDADAVDPQNLRVTANIKSQTGYFSDHLYLAVGTEKDGEFTLISRFESPIYYILPDESATVSFGGALSADEGEIYTAYLQYTDEKKRKYYNISDSMTFTVKRLGVENITSDSCAASDDYISLDGVNHGSDPAGIAPGVYIRGGQKVLVK